MAKGKCTDYTETNTVGRGGFPVGAVGKCTEHTEISRREAPGRGTMDTVCDFVIGSIGPCTR